MTDTGFQCGKQHPRFVPDALLLAQLALIPLGTLRLTGKVEQRPRSRRYVEATCDRCTQTRWILVDNIRARKTTNCTCQGKYNDPRSETLGERFDSMVQRCRRDTHVSSHNYKGRGIQVLFQSREQFIRWALENYPDSNFKGLDFDRTDNNGHYEPSNLRLATRSENLKNRSRSPASTTS